MPQNTGSKETFRYRPCCHLDAKYLGDKINKTALGITFKNQMHSVAGLHSYRGLSAASGPTSFQ